jgi:hypothetical protein
MQSSTPVRSGAEVVSVELVGGTDLGKGRWMEHDRDGRCEFGSELASA